MNSVAAPAGSVRPGGRAAVRRDGLPLHRKGRLPDPSAKRAQRAREGFGLVPAPLLHGGLPNPGVLVWPLLRLNFDDVQGERSQPHIARKAGEASCRAFADRPGLDGLSAGTAEQRFDAAVEPWLGSWILRRSLAGARSGYQAGDAARSHRARVRVSELLRLSDGDGRGRPDVPDLAGFYRWQLDCGSGGWTAAPLRRLAERWRVSQAAIGCSTDRLARLGRRLEDGCCRRSVGRPDPRAV